MILGLLLVGGLSAFALGPASFNIIRTLISKRTWPWASIAGFLAGDLVYIGLALILLQSALLQMPWLRISLTSLTVLCLMIYSIRILLPKQKLPETFLESFSSPSFKKSFLLTLANFHLVFIYAGLFANLGADGKIAIYSGALAYFIGFLLGFFSLLYGLHFFQSSLRTLLRKMEVVAAFGFLTFSIYLSLEIL
ncbi:MAG: LysE family transporter [Bdellovibrio sp.]|nr:LysE family transporter [Bdellovibrio sp.]